MLRGHSRMQRNGTRRREDKQCRGGHADGGCRIGTPPGDDRRAQRAGRCVRATGGKGELRTGRESPTGRGECAETGRAWAGLQGHARATGLGGSLCSMQTEMEGGGHIAPAASQERARLQRQARWTCSRRTRPARSRTVRAAGAGGTQEGPEGHPADCCRKTEIPGAVPGMTRVPRAQATGVATATRPRGSVDSR